MAMPPLHPSAHPAAESAPTGDDPDLRLAKRLHALADAQRSITFDLALSALHARIVRAACALAGARSGVLVRTDGSGHHQRVAAHGLAGGAELFVPVIARPGTQHTQFLDYPVHVRGELYGRLHLRDPRAGAFDDVDDALLAAFVVSAGTAIDSARLHEDAQRSNDWLHASAQIARALLANADVDALLQVVTRALYVAEADYGALIMPVAGGQLQVAATIGLGADSYGDMVFQPAHSELGRAIMEGRSMLVADMWSLVEPGSPNICNYGPAMVAPLVDAQGIRGGVLLVRTADNAPFTPRDLDLATVFADQVALALRLNDARLEAESLHALENEHAVSRALHDNVMQRLFATGVGLETLADRDLPPAVASRLRGHIGDLDDTIDEIRDRVFSPTGDDDTAGADVSDRFIRVPHETLSLNDPPAL